MVLTGLQLITSWLLIIVLAELSQREVKAEADLGELVQIAGQNQKQREAQSVETAVPLQV